jgi:hypothetical protein
VSNTADEDFEALIRRALVPIEPPDDLAARLESTLVNLTDLAADELEAWELSAMRDPRNWVRPAAATVVGGAAGAALGGVRVRNGRRKRVAESEHLLDLAGKTLRDLASEAQILLDRPKKR